MRWSIFMIVALVLLVVQEGFRSLWSINNYAPNLLLILCAYVVMHTPPATGRWAAIILGLLIDLAHGPISLPLIGPTALGFLAAALVMHELRNLIYRDSPLALTVLVGIGGIFAYLVVVALITLRGLPILHSDPVARWVASNELVDRFWELLYTTVVAFPFGLMLARYEKGWGFRSSSTGSGGTAYRTRK